jgi:hypothetical protein
MLMNSLISHRRRRRRLDSARWPPAAPARPCDAHPPPTPCAHTASSCRTAHRTHPTTGGGGRRPTMVSAGCCCCGGYTQAMAGFANGARCQSSCAQCQRRACDRPWDGGGGDCTRGGRVVCAHRPSRRAAGVRGQVDVHQTQRAHALLLATPEHQPGTPFSILNIS